MILKQILKYQLALLVTMLFSTSALRSEEYQTLLPVNIDGSYGYIDTTGKMVIRPAYDYGQMFAQNRAWIYLNKKFGLIDEKGKLLVRPRYDWAWAYADNLAPVRKNKKWGFVNRSGKVVIPLYYDEARSFSEGLAAVKKGDAWGYVDTAGKLVIPPQFKEANEFSDGYAQVLIPAGVDERGEIKVTNSFIDRNGKIATHLQFDSALSFWHDLAPVEVKGKWGYVNTKGKLIIKPQFDFAYPFTEATGVARVRNKERQYGFIDRRGKPLVELSYYDAKPAYDGIAFVQETRDPCSRKIIDYHDKEVSDLGRDECEESKAEQITSVYRMGKGVYRLYKNRNNKNPFYINARGEYIWKPKEITMKGADPQPDWFFITTHHRWVSPPASNDIKIASPKNVLPVFIPTDETGGGAVEGYTKDLKNQQNAAASAPLATGDSLQPADYDSYIRKADYKKMERDILAEMNKIRTNPQNYIKELQKRRSQIKGKQLYLPGFPTYINLHEGQSAVDEAIAVLKKQKKLGALSSSRPLQRAARDHVVDQGRTGIIGHGGSDGSSPFQRMERYGRWLITAGENIAYGQKFGQQVVIDLFVDDGVYDRGHRANILNPNFKVAGVACGPHKRIGTMCNIDFAGGFAAK